MNPADRRLAVMVEDHPLEYANFEGVIPAGNYGAGSVIVWDRGAYRVTDPPGGDAAQAIRDGKLDFELQGFKLHGAFTLVRTRIGRGSDQMRENNWLLIKKRDSYSSDQDVTTLHPRSVLSGLTVDEIADAPSIRAEVVKELARMGARPLRGPLEPAKFPLSLAKLIEKPFDGNQWLFEIKYDGVRALAIRDGARVRLFARSGIDITARYPEVTIAFDALPFERFVMDGEIVALDEGGRPNFQSLQHRMHVQDAAAALRLSLSVPVCHVLFDLLAFDDFDLRALELETRKRLLARLIRGEGPLRYCGHVEAQGRKFFEAVSELGLEGIIAKKRDSPYRGARSGDWLKIKGALRRRFVIGGYTKPAGSRSHFGALLLGLYEPDGRLRFVGKVGTGFSEESLAKLSNLMGARRTATSPLRPPSAKERSIPRGATFCRPELVCEVRFAEVTNDRCVRHPSFLRLIENADPRECRFENPFRSPDQEGPPIGSNRKNEGTARSVQSPAVRITRPEKVFWPKDGYTKGDLIQYYESVARRILPYLRDRPVMITRYPDGIEGKSFYQKDAPRGTPDWVRTEKIYSEQSGRVLSYLVIDRPEALKYVANLGAIPIHVWSSRIPQLERPDWLLFDLDPKGTTTARAIEVACELIELVRGLDLRPVVKTSGQAGLHVMVGLKPVYTYEQARGFSELLAKLLVSRIPELATLQRAIRLRKARVYIDYLQLGHGKTIVAPYAVRPLPGAPVSAPLRPSELKPRLDPRDYNIRSVPRRMSKLGSDPFAGALEDRQELEAALPRLRQALEKANLLR